MKEKLKGIVYYCVDGYNACFKMKEKYLTRRLYNFNKESMTGYIRLNNNKEKIKLRWS